MYVSEWTEGKGWDQGELKPYGPMQLMPSAQVRASYSGSQPQHGALPAMCAAAAAAAATPSGRDRSCRCAAHKQQQECAGICSREACSGGKVQAAS